MKNRKILIASVVAGLLAGMSHLPKAHAEEGAAPAVKAEDANTDKKVSKKKKKAKGKATVAGDKMSCNGKESCDGKDGCGGKEGCMHKETKDADKKENK